MWALAGELLSRARIPEAFLFATSIIGSFCIQVALLLTCPCDCLLHVPGVPVSYFSRARSSDFGVSNCRMRSSRFCCSSPSRFSLAMPASRNQSVSVHHNLPTCRIHSLILPLPVLSRRQTSAVAATFGTSKSTAYEQFWVVVAIRARQMQPG